MPTAQANTDFVRDMKNLGLALSVYGKAPCVKVNETMLKEVILATSVKLHWLRQEDGMFMLMPA